MDYFKTICGWCRDGRWDEAFALFQQDPSGGAASGGAPISRQMFVTGMLDMRDMYGVYKVAGSGKQIPRDRDHFDWYVARERFDAIENVSVMQDFLVRAAYRFHELGAQIEALLQQDLAVPFITDQAYFFLREQFLNPGADLMMFFSETKDYPSQSAQEKRRLASVAQTLVGSGWDASKIDAAKRLCEQGLRVPSNSVGPAF